MVGCGTASVLRQGWRDQIEGVSPSSGSAGWDEGFLQVADLGRAAQAPELCVVVIVVVVVA